MAVSKRTRYEVLRRDNHACRYCGQMAPDVKLTVDHVTPVALGGSDKPDNLVAACVDCNAGKSSTSPDASLVEDVRADALRHAELVKGAYAVLVERMGERDDYVDEFARAWRIGAPEDWRNTIGRWFEMGVPLEIVIDAAETARTRSTVRNDGRFTYMCGIVWNQVRMVDELAEAKRHIEGTFASEDFLTEERIAAYSAGRAAGERNEARLQVRYDPLSYVVDRISYPALDDWGVPV